MWSDPRDFFTVRHDKEGNEWALTGDGPYTLWSGLDDRPEGAILIPKAWFPVDGDGYVSKDDAVKAFQVTHAGWGFGGQELLWIRPAPGWQWSNTLPDEDPLSEHACVKVRIWSNRTGAHGTTLIVKRPKTR